MDTEEKQMLSRIINKLGNKKELNNRELNIYISAKYLLGM